MNMAPLVLQSRIGGTAFAVGYKNNQTMKTIKISIIALLTVFIIQSAEAQVSLGIKGGLNFANINTSSPGAAYNSRTGYHAGAFVLIKLAKLGIQPEFIYSQQGSTIQFNGSNFDANFTYLNIPIIAKLYVIGGFNLQAGPQFGFLMSANGPVNNNGTVSSQDIKGTLNGSDISVALGGGFDFPFGMSLDARYNLGVSDVNTSASASAIKNQVIQISLGFKLIRF